MVALSGGDVCVCHGLEKREGGIMYGAKQRHDGDVYIFSVLRRCAGVKHAVCSMFIDAVCSYSMTERKNKIRHQHITREQTAGQSVAAASGYGELGYRTMRRGCVGLVMAKKKLRGGTVLRHKAAFCGSRVHAAYNARHACALCAGI